ncbi:MAG: S8 family serine peptidase, partial [Bdellovibrionota bacterium]
MKYFLLRVIAALLLIFAAPQSIAEAADGARAYREGEVIVKYRDDSQRSANAMAATYTRAKAVDVKRFHGALKNFEHMTFDTTDQTVESVMADLSRNPDVEYVQPNYILYAHDEQPAAAAKPCLIPGIPYPPGCSEAAAPSEPPQPAPSAEAGNPSIPGRGSRPGVMPRPNDVGGGGDPSQSLAWGVSKIGATQAWARSKGSRNVIVAVIDTGIDYNHPDLAANVWRNPNFGKTATTGIDADATTGISGDLVGWDFVHNDNLPYDDFGHGTHVSGTIGAVGNNGVGVSGVNQQVSIMAVKFLGSNGSGDTAAAIRGIDYAISRGAKVLNNSWGGRGGENTALRDAIQRSANAGALFVSSAGNDGTNNDSYPSYPASFTVSNMITVAATTSNDTLASFSNVGAQSVHLGAPGVKIYSTLPGGKYGYMSGTSMASPHVTGAAALVWAAHPNYTAAQVKERLLNTGHPLPSLQGKTV